MFEMLLGTAKEPSVKSLLNLPTNMTGLTGTIKGDDVWVLNAGTSRSSTHSDIFKINKHTGEYTLDKNLSVPWFDSGAVFIGDSIYTYGGRNVAFNYSRNRQVYDTVSKTLVTDTNVMPKSNYRMSCVYDGAENHYVLNGRDRDFHKFTSTLVKTVLAPLPVDTMGGILFFHNGDIYHYGGWIDSQNRACPNVYKYIIATNVWDLHHVFNTATHGTIAHGGHMHDGKLRFIGWNAFLGSNKLVAFAYDVDSNTYSHGIDTLLGYQNDVLVVGDEMYLYALGGCNLPLGNASFGNTENNSNKITRIKMI